MKKRLMVFVFLSLGACLIPAASSVRAQQTNLQLIVAARSLERSPTVLELNVPTTILISITAVNFTPNTQGCRLIRQLDQIDPATGSDLVIYPLPPFQGTNPFTTVFSISPTQANYFPTAAGLVRLTVDCPNPAGGSEGGGGSNRVDANQVFLFAAQESAPQTGNVTFFSPEGDCALTVPGGSQRHSAFLGVGKPRSTELPPGTLPTGCIGIAQGLAPFGGPTFSNPLQLSIKAPNPDDCSLARRYYLVQQIATDAPVQGGMGPGLFTLDTGTAIQDAVLGCRIVSDAQVAPSGSGKKPPQGTNKLAGLFGGGTIGLIPETNSGFVTGRVCAQTNLQGNPVTSCAGTGNNTPILMPFAKVQNLADYPNVDDASAKAFFTNAAGEFIVPINVRNWKLFVYDAFGCATFTQATTSSLTTTQSRNNAVVSQADIVLTTPIASPYSLTRAGIRHGGFEGFGKGAFFKCWVPSLSTLVSVDQAGSGLVDFDLNGAVSQGSPGSTTPLNPSEGSAMAVLKACPTCSGGTTTLQQTFLLPVLLAQTGLTKQLSLDFNFGCSAANGGCFSDGGVSANFTLAGNTVQKSLSGNAGGWQTVQFDVSGLVPKTQQTLTIQLIVGTTSNANLRLAVDHVRFNEVGVYSNIAFTNGDATAPITATEAGEQLKWANVLLSQIGVNLNDRGTVTWDTTQNPSGSVTVNACNPTGAPLTAGGTDITYTTAIRQVPSGVSQNKGVVTEAAKSLLCMAIARNRGTAGFQASDVQIVHVPQLKDTIQTGFVIHGAAMTLDDYHGESSCTPCDRTYNSSENSTDPNRNASGILLSNLTSTDFGKPEARITTIAHEFVHLLDQVSLNPDAVAGGMLEHAAADPLNTMAETLCVPQGSSQVPSGSTKCSTHPNLDTPVPNPGVLQASAVDLPNP